MMNENLISRYFFLSKLIIILIRVDKIEKAEVQ